MKKADFRKFVERHITDFPRYENQKQTSASLDVEVALEEMEDHIDVVRDFLRAMVAEAEAIPADNLGYINRLSRAVDTMQTLKCECYEMWDEVE